MRWPSRMTLPPTTRPGLSSRPIAALPMVDLPAPDSPTTPRISPEAKLEGDVPGGDRVAAPRGEFHPEIFDVENGAHGAAVTSAWD